MSVSAREPSTKRRGKTPQSLADSEHDCLFSRKAAKSAKKDKDLHPKKRFYSLVHLPFLATLASWREDRPFLVCIVRNYWCIRNSSDLSSIVGLQWSVREGRGFAAPMLFGAFAPSFLRSHCGDKGLFCEEIMPYPGVTLFWTPMIATIRLTVCGLTRKGANGYGDT